MPRKQSAKPPARRRRAPRQTPSNPALDQAQQLIYDAWDSGDPRREVELANEALRISPLCADAYVILAHHAARGSRNEFEFWRRGVEAGQAALGDAFEEYVGAFWGVLETRPYMRARLGLAMALWARGACEHAISHAREMLRLNPNDNQGVRYALAAWLAGSEEEDDDGKPKFYPVSGFIEWEWTAALAAFRRGGDTATSRRLLDSAASQYPAVVPYLAGAKRLPRVLPPYENGEPADEAINYVADHAFAWRKTPGALAWLRARLATKEAAQRARRGGKTVH
jgi:tetratricopeptide (TPR) repeat protein